MSNSKDIFKALISEDLVNAKKFINNALLEKLGNSLEEKLVNFAPTVLEKDLSKILFIEPLIEDELPDLIILLIIFNSSPENLQLSLIVLMYLFFLNLK